MKNLLIILTILISSVGYSQSGYVSAMEKFLIEHVERSKTPYLFSLNAGKDSVDFENFNEPLVEYLILKKINDYRIENNRPLLVEDSLIKNLAKGWSEEMDSTNLFYHNPNAEAMECITMDNGSVKKMTYNEITESVFQVWKNSKGHNYIMLMEDSYYGSVGVSYTFKGCNEYSDSGVNLCEMFNLKGSYKIYTTFNSINNLKHL
tara:strand:- start:32 stop:646 length:615 start_codon:yes stop_codon:yes gene_type:complete